jgi:hypothetical protein
MRVAARRRFYRDGTLKDSAQHQEIARRYAWESYERKRQLPPPRAVGTGRSRLIALIRLAELERLASLRYGAVLPNNDVGREYFVTVAHHIAHLGPEVVREISGWARVWAPWMSLQEAHEIATRVAAGPRKFKAAVLGSLLKLSEVERRLLGVTTIAPSDLSAEDRRSMQRFWRRSADRLRRRRKGAKSRSEYESASLSRTKPWDTLGISRRTWYRRGRPMPSNDHSRSGN